MRKKSIVFTAVMLGLGMLHFNFMSFADDSKQKANEGIISLIAPTQPISMRNDTIAQDEYGNQVIGGVSDVEGTDNAGPTGASARPADSLDKLFGPSGTILPPPKDEVRERRLMD